jgi:hypothetical protein
VLFKHVAYDRDQSGANNATKQSVKHAHEGFLKDAMLSSFGVVASDVEMQRLPALEVWLGRDSISATG